jgi:glycosyltransferase involved in cell wall biosynthesis
MFDTQDRKRRNTILFISHEATLSGAPRVLLGILRWFRAHTDFHLRVVLRAGGPLEGEFRDVSEVHFESEGWSESLIRDVCLIYSNTATNGIYLQSRPIRGIPVITHLHELGEVLRWFGPENSAAVLSQSSHLIACSKDVRRMLELDFLVDPGTVSVVPEAIVPSDIQTLAGARTRWDIRQEWGIGPDDFLVTACGNAEVRKGIDLFVQVAHSCRQRAGSGRIAFLWVGQVGNDLANSYYLRDIGMLDLRQVLRLTGSMQNPIPILAASDLLCLPSREDPFPIVMLEAGALGKATVAFSGSGGPEEYCGKGGGFLVPYMDVSSMASRILELANNREELEKAGAKAKQLVESEFTLDTVGPALESIIRRTLIDEECEMSGMAQVFMPCTAGHTEENSICRPVRSYEWNRLQFRILVEDNGQGWILRFDPLDRPGLIEIASMRLRSAADSRILWAAENAAAFAALTVAGTAVPIQGESPFRMLNLGTDPILYFPRIDVVPGEYLFLEVDLRVDCDIRQICNYSSPVLDAFRQNAGLKRELDRTKSALQLSQNAGDRVKALLRAIAPAGRRDLYIWGTGAAGREIAGILLTHAVNFAGFVDKEPGKAGPSLLDHPVIGAADLKTQRERPFVVVGSQYYREIGADLEVFGFIEGRDYAVPMWPL